jgi:hypothetical protein
MAVLEEALNIALDYLEYTEQAVRYRETRSLCAKVILAAWRCGIQHRVHLANCGIVAVEQKARSLSSAIPIRMQR